MSQKRNITKEKALSFREIVNFDQEELESISKDVAETLKPLLKKSGEPENINDRIKH